MQKSRPRARTLSSGQGCVFRGKAGTPAELRRGASGVGEGRQQKVRAGGEHPTPTSWRERKPGGSGISTLVKEFRKHRGFHSALYPARDTRLWGY